jgi:NADH-quinone oxidoreductase subunit N
MENFFNIIQPIVSWLPLIIAILVILLLETIVKNDSNRYSALIIGLLGLTASLILLILDLRSEKLNNEFFGGSIAFNSFGIGMSIIAVIGTILTLFISHDYIQRIKSSFGEYYALLLTACLGVVILGYSGDFYTFFIAFELMSIPTYILTSFSRYSLTSQEAGAKYLVLGAFSSAIFLFGIAFFYGATGEVQFGAINEKLKLIEANQPHFYFMVMGISLVSIGIFFKVGAVPFHVWVPDVYQGAPTPVTAFMASVIKIGGFLVIVRLISEVFLQNDPSAKYSLGSYWSIITTTILLISLVSMIFGNLIAIFQRNIKRMLAYSSIAHTGYLLLAVLALPLISSGEFGNHTEYIFYAIIFYLLAYTVMTLGIFSALIHFSAGEKKELQTLDEIKGMGRKYRLNGLTMTVCLVGLAGIPATSGFMGKFFVFSSIFSSLKNGIPEGATFAYIVIFIGLLTSVVSLFYYIRVIAYLYYEPSSSNIQPQPAWNYALVSFLTLAITILLGFLPSLVKILI